MKNEVAAGASCVLTVVFLLMVQVTDAAIPFVIVFLLFTAVLFKRAVFNQTCTSCRREIAKQARVCPNCHAELAAA